MTFFQMKSLNTLVFDLVLDMLANGLRSSTYVFRGKVLAEIFEMRTSSLMDDTYYIDTYTHAGWLAQQLFRQWPSIKESSTCTECQSTKVKNLTGIQVEDIHLQSSSSESFILDFCTTPNSTCIQCNTLNSVENKLIEIGN